MDKRRRTEKILARLEEEYGEASTALVFSNALELLVATILSAQCTDKRVNMITARLFPKYEDLLGLADLPAEVLEEEIRSSGFYRSKARNIRNCMRIIRERYGGEVPSSMRELVALPGVARKTANIVLYNHFGKNEGIAVDTHVKRVSGRLGLTENTSPERIEKDLMGLIARDRWGRFSDMMIQHGRNVCKARRPACELCSLARWCPSVER